MRRAVPIVLFWAGIVLVLLGWATTAPWRHVALGPASILAGLAVAATIVAWGIGLVLRCRFATAVLAVWLAALVACAGFAPSAAVVLTAAAALAIGSCIVPEDWSGRVALSVLIGLALMVGVVGWTLPFHISHIRVVYSVVLFALVVWRWRSLGAILRPLPMRWSEAVSGAPVAAALAMTALGVVSTCAWLPTVMYDALSYHLALPSQLVTLGYYQMNAGSNIWALAPWSADVLQAIAWVVAGVESRGPTDVLWFVLSAMLLWRLCEALDLRPELRWLAVGLFGSIPESANTLASMQTEGPTIAVMFGLALLIQCYNKPDRRALVVIGILFGLLVGLKVSNLWFALPLGLWLLWRWRGSLPWQLVPVAMLAGVIVAGSSYVYAWLLTGNPVLPLFNGIFHSPYYWPTNFYDSQWHSGFSWGIVWNVVFHSSEYFEGGYGAAAFFLIGLGGSFFVALARPKSRVLAIAAAATLVLPLSVIQYLRYATPGMALLIPTMLCGLPPREPSRLHHWTRYAAMWLLVAAALLFVTSVSWQLQRGVLRTWLATGDPGVFKEFAPTRSIVQVIRQRYNTTARTLMLVPGQPMVAELAGKGFGESWYDPKLSTILNRPDSDGNAAKWFAAIQMTGANLLITPSASLPSGLQNAIIADRGTLEYSVGGLDLWQLHSGEPGVATSAAGHGLSIVFDTTSAPVGQTLVHGELELTCDPRLAEHGHIVVGWQVRKANGRDEGHYSWALCRPGGIATATFDSAVSGKVTAFTVSVQPDTGSDMGLGLVSSRANFRVNRTAAEDLANTLRQDFRLLPKLQGRLGPS